MKQLIIVILLLLLMSPLCAQNAIFEKYAEREDVEYICITSSMLKLLGENKNSATINGVRIEGITNAIKIILIVHSSDEKARMQMKSDFDKLRADERYEVLMNVNNNGERVTTLCNSEKAIKEIIMYIANRDENNTFVVLTGKFTDEQIKKLLNKE